MPNLGVEVAVVRGNSILLTQRKDFRIWALPGGGVEDGESLNAAAVRETLEETGLSVELIDTVGIYSRPTWCEGGDHDILFVAHSVGGKLKTVSDEVVASGFFTEDTLPKPLIGWHRQRISDTLSGKRNVVCIQDSLWNTRFGNNLAETRQKITEGNIKLSEVQKLFADETKSESVRFVNN